MQNFTATYKNKSISLVNTTKGVAVGTMNLENKQKIHIEMGGHNYQCIASNKTIQVFKDDKLIDVFDRNTRFKNFKSKNNNCFIKGISSWKGGTKLVDTNNNTLASLNNKSAWIDKGIYEFTTVAEIEAYQLLIMLLVHITSSKVKTTIAVVTSVSIMLLMTNLLS